MPTDRLGFPPSADPDRIAATGEIEGFKTLTRSPRYGAAGEAASLAATEQIVRDTAEIERAVAALRRSGSGHVPNWRSDPPVMAGQTVRGRPLANLLWVVAVLALAGAAIAALAR